MQSNYKLVLLLFLGLSLNAFAQTKADALRDAKITSKAAKEMDFDLVLKHTLPSVLDMMGGKDVALSVLKATFEGMEDQGFVFEKANVVSVSEVVEEQGQYRCLVESYKQMLMSGQRISSTSHLLGIYNEADNYWWFIETKQLNNNAMTTEILPNFKTGIEIPEDSVSMEAVKS